MSKRPNTTSFYSYSPKYRVVTMPNTRYLIDEHLFNLIGDDRFHAKFEEYEGINHTYKVQVRKWFFWFDADNLFFVDKKSAITHISYLRKQEKIKKTPSKVVYIE